MHASIPGGYRLVTGLLACFAMFAAYNAAGHGKASEPSELDEARLIEFPDTTNFKTLVVDLHTHSVFSDGHVWPNVRVSEAQRDGLDALAITEHLEYQPHRRQLPHPATELRLAMTHQIQPSDPAAGLQQRDEGCIPGEDKRLHRLLCQEPELHAVLQLLTDEQHHRTGDDADKVEHEDENDPDRDLSEADEQ